MDCRIEQHERNGASGPLLVSGRGGNGSSYELGNRAGG